MNVGFRFMDGKLDWGWISARNRILRVEDTSGIVAVNSDTGELIAACVMDNWTANAVQCHIIIDHPAALRHKFLEQVFEYVFTERDKKLIIGLVPTVNTKAMKFDKHLGFTVKTILEGIFENSDYAIMELKRENCPYWAKIEEDTPNGKT